MAHFEKYKGSNAYIVLKHDNRTNTDNRENIDHSRTHLNYNLCDVENAESRLKELIQKSKESGATIRDDSNLVVSLVLTLPKNFPDNEELKKQFFKATVEMIADDFGKDNIISAWVHCDENIKNEDRPNLEHIHIKFAPIREKEKKYKNGTVKKILSFDAKNCINKNYLQKFHKRLDDYICDYIGFKADIINGATKGGNKSIEELKAISEQIRANREQIEKDSDLILAEQKKILNEQWKRYQNSTRATWQQLAPLRSRIKNNIWELKKGDRTAERDLKKDLDFFANLSYGLIYALGCLLNALFIFSRKKTIEKQKNDLEAVLEDLESIRRTYSNQQHNVKETLLNKDLEKIENTLNRLEDTTATAHEFIREVLLRMPDMREEQHLEREDEIEL